jgi:hypothetical protein
VDSTQAAIQRTKIREDDSKLRKFALLLSGFLLLCFALTLTMYDIKYSKSQKPGTVCFTIGE